jgi:hypothetical protein
MITPTDFWLLRHTEMPQTNSDKFALQLLEDYAEFIKPKPVEQVTADQVIAAVTEQLGVIRESISKRNRKREFVEARQLCQTLLKFGLRMTHSQAGLAIGRYDHATVISSIKQVSNRYNCYLAYRNKVDQIVSELFPASQWEYIITRIVNPALDRYENSSRLVVSSPVVERSAV